MSRVERIFTEDKENSCSLNEKSILDNQAAFIMTEYSDLDHISDKLCDLETEKEELMEKDTGKENDRKNQLTRFYEELKHSDSWESDTCEAEEEELGQSISPVEIPTLSEEQRRILISSWELIQDKISEVGVSAYNELFRLSPQAIQFFPKLFGYKEGDEEKFQEVVKDHSIRILGIIGLIVRNLSKIKGNDQKAYYSFYKFSFQLGEKHFRYGANPRLMGLLGLAFATSMKQTLLDLEDPEEMEEAWKSFFCVVTSWMRRGFLYIQNKGREVDVYKLPLEEVLGS